jgi:hypothetical protein
LATPAFGLATAFKNSGHTGYFAKSGVFVVGVGHAHSRYPAQIPSQFNVFCCETNSPSRTHFPRKKTMTTIDTTKALNLFDLFDTNRESEEDGVWIDLNGVTKFKIRAFSAKAVVDLRDKLMKPFQTMIRANLEIPEDKNEEIGLKVIAGAVLSDWPGVEIDDTDVPYSADAAYTLLKQLPKLANFIAQSAMNTQNFRDEAREDSAKN